MTAHTHLYAAPEYLEGAPPLDGRRTISIGIA